MRASTDSRCRSSKDRPRTSFSRAPDDRCCRSTSRCRSPRLGHGVDHAAVIVRAGVARHAVAAERRRRSDRHRRIRQRTIGIRRRKPLDGARPRQSAADVFVEAQGRRSPRRTCRCASARASLRRSASAKRSRRSRRSCASKCSKAWRAKSRSRFPRDSSSTRSTARRLPTGRQGRFAAVRLLDPVATELSFVVQGESRLPADGDIGVPLVRVPAAEREIGGVAISVLGAGEIEKHQMRGLEPGDISDLADIVAGHESPSTVAFRLRPASGNRFAVAQHLGQALHAASGPHRQHRRSAVSRRSRPKTACSSIEARYAIRNNQRSFLKVTLPPRATIWSASVAGKSVRPGVAEGEAVLLRAREGPRRRGCADIRRSVSPTCNRSIRGLSPQPRDSICRRSIFRSRAPALSCITRRVFASSRSLELFASSRIRVCSPRHCASIAPTATALRAGYAATPPPPAAPPAAIAAEAPAAIESPDDQTGKTTQFRMLIDRYRNEGGGRTVSGALPDRRVVPNHGSIPFHGCRADGGIIRAVDRSLGPSSQVGAS